MGRKRIKESAFLHTVDPMNIGKGRAEYFKVRKKDDMREGRHLWRIFEDLFFSSDDDEIYMNTGRNLLSRQQLCVAKMQVGYDKGSHMKFLKEYLTQKNKDDVIEKPELFSDERVDDGFIENYKKNMSGLHFKWIISPENTGVDCAALTRTLIKRMELVTGYKFGWLAAVHKNTAHPPRSSPDKRNRQERKEGGLFQKDFFETVGEGDVQIITARATKKVDPILPEV